MKEKFVYYNANNLNKFCFHPVFIKILTLMDKNNEVFLNQYIKKEIALQTHYNYRSLQNVITAIIKSGLMIRLETNHYSINKKYYKYGN